jgi:hypothetical protein
MRVLIFFFALTLSFTTESQTLKVDGLDMEFDSFMAIYETMNALFEFNSIDPNQPLVDDSDGDYNISNPAILFNDVKSGVNVEIVYTIQATDEVYVAAYIFFDTDGYGVRVWAAKQPDYDPRKIK